ncbi:hypothetical protein M011DRAFT_469519 [Sporormia fimetaria CBS 119925]|uniref:Uncharacterized protein n=1 Tax=Sporormia fimetaria CBS 119925 TaxID=1340428 RepID=A0A6A6V4B1_9PLEO|nr:hypothetical protein M011DRAFT_469519 [Sporormia fimetaria CBS 119925]
MSDYGDDDYSDYGDDDWLYIEDEYMPADELAEHAVHSPPHHMAYDDDSEELDRFEYFIDLDYASDGYDDAEFYTHGTQPQGAGTKRKRAAVSVPSKKKRKLQDGGAVSSSTVLGKTCSPIVFRPQSEREVKPKVVHGNMESYAVLKDWRERLPDTPSWPTTKSPQDTATLDPKSPPKPATVREEDDNPDSDGIASSALLAALQKNMAAAGGPLSGMDPHQLLQFVTRMMNNEGAADDIAGELANDLLAQGADDEDEDDAGEPSEDMLDWLSKQRNGKPPTPPSSERETADDPKTEGTGRARTQGMTSVGATAAASKRSAKADSKTGEKARR